MKSVVDGVLCLSRCLEFFFFRNNGLLFCFIRLSLPQAKKKKGKTSGLFERLLFSLCVAGGYPSVWDPIKLQLIYHTPSGNNRSLSVPSRTSLIEGSRVCECKSGKCGSVRIVCCVEIITSECWSVKLYLYIVAYITTWTRNVCVNRDWAIVIISLPSYAWERPYPLCCSAKQPCWLIFRMPFEGKSLRMEKNWYSLNRDKVEKMYVSCVSLDSTVFHNTVYVNSRS